MTSKVKDQIKAFFLTGLKPTQSQFTDFIDSYVDKSGPVGLFETACSSNGTGPVIVTTGTPSIGTYGALKNSMGITIATTADVVTSLLYATTAQANAGTATGSIMDPVLTKNAIAAQATSVVKVIKSPQVFRSGGTYTPSSGLLYAIVEAVGAGGGGGGTVAAAGAATGAGGGGAGSYSIAVLTAAQIGASQTVSIGAAGAAGTTLGGAGGAGGDTSLGSLVVAKGGNGGTGCTAAGDKGKPGGVGGLASGSTGDLKNNGAGGHDGFGASIQTTNSQGGAGGNSRLGPGGSTASAVTSGATAGRDGADGGGGSGGASVTSGTAVGGAGGAGLLIITEYCSQ